MQLGWEGNGSGVTEGAGDGGDAHLPGVENVRPEFPALRQAEGDRARPTVAEIMQDVMLHLPATRLAGKTVLARRVHPAFGHSQSRIILDIARA